MSEPPLDSPLDDAQGWFLPGSELLFLRSETDLVVLDSTGAELARFEGQVARALAERLRGDPGESPLLSTVLRAVPALEQAVADGSLPLTAGSLLGRRGWGNLFVELTWRCNERCAHCYASADPDREEALDHATLRTVVRDAAALGFQVLQLTGGEPLLVPFLDDVVREAVRLGIPTVEVFTNGLLLDASRYAALRDAGAAFAFSLYARTPKVHDGVTGVPGSHQLTTEAIRTAVEGGSQVRVAAIATRPELDDEAREAAQLARELGVVPASAGAAIARDVGRGHYVARELGQAGCEAEGAPRGGKAAVLADGRVVPCIFSRELTLGHVDGGLRSALERSSPHALTVGEPSVVAARLRASQARLTCAECRLVEALLGGPKEVLT